jgi:hypothetical protein
MILDRSSQTGTHSRPNESSSFENSNFREVLIRSHSQERTRGTVLFTTVGLRCILIGIEWCVGAKVALHRKKIFGLLYAGGSGSAPKAEEFLARRKRDKGSRGSETPWR